MADKSIVDLPQLSEVTDATLIPVYQPNSDNPAQKMPSSVFRNWAEDAVFPAAKTAQEAATVATGAKTAAQSALVGVQNAIKNIPAGSTPIVNDLTTGGVTLALSAEQGKKLNSGKVSKSGDTMTGQLTARQRLYAEFPDAIKAGLEAHSSGAVDLQRLTLDGKYSAIRLYDDKGTGAQPVFCGNDTGAWYQYPLYHTGNKPTAADVGALARDGSNTMTGMLKVPNGIAVNKLRVEDWGSGEALIRFYDRNGNGNRYISIWDKTKTDSLKTALLFAEEVNGVYSVNQILHTGNKPSGSYTGNGDAASRTITTGGIGRVVEVFRNGYAAILFQGGAIILQYSGNTASVSAIPSASVWTSEGSFAMKTTHAALNENGVTYYYQVL